MINLDEASETAIIDASKIADRTLGQILPEVNGTLNSIHDLIRFGIKDEGVLKVQIDSFLQANDARIGRITDDGLTLISQRSHRTAFLAVARTYSSQKLEEMDLLEALKVKKRKLKKSNPTRPRKKRIRLPQLSTREIREVLERRGYKTRLRKWSKKITDKDKVQRIIARGLAAGDSQNAIAKRIQPYVQAYLSSAQRIVRTEASFVHNHFTLQAIDEFDDVVGYKILNPLDGKTRPAHSKRAGRIHWKNSKRKYNLSNRPTLPDEPNCRCGWSPVMQN